ncbi:DNA-binding domain-containing protein [Microbulbifer magnicolonia]|uniref:HvfC/BufC N-terminal domain-containing protein n=1 Tax=Microbulbifer magnicolonia TaxID=3109744 RepID=UPI002B40ECC6|nr:DNA-binding domain-containing protein [Microbulbifer sp. GG15]
MSELLRDRQRQLMAYLLHGDAAIDAHICAGGTADKSTRLGIYANAYRKRLQETLDADHPMLGLYLGDDLCEQMAYGYIDRHPSQHPSLRHFGEQLPDFLAAAEPFCRQPLIAELARFERLLMTVFDAADAGRLSLDSLQQLPASAWPQLRLCFHPSVRLWHSGWNCVQVWQALRAEEVPPPQERREFHWLLWRNRERLTEFTSVAGAELIAVRAAFDGADFSRLCEHLLELVPAERAAGTLAQLLQAWIQRGWLSGVDQAE